MKPGALAKLRYTTKKFDSTRTIPAEDMDEIKSLLQYAPSSTNLQPWHFVIAGTKAAKSKVANATQGPFAFNEQKIHNASHVVILCSRVWVDEPYLLQVLNQEDQDGRFAADNAKKGQHEGRSYFVNLHRYEARDIQAWMEKQTYIALGGLLLGAPMLGIDACPIEGFDPHVLNREFDLARQGVTATMLVALGYHSPEDFNYGLQKSRLPQSATITEV